jgi:hypothetical protein
LKRLKKVKMGSLPPERIADLIAVAFAIVCIVWGC